MPKLSRIARWCCFCFNPGDSGEEEDGSRGSVRWVFSLKELRSATNDFNFDNKIGDGPAGSVFWGQLWDGSQIAVKRLRRLEKSEVDFASEVEILGRVRHKNLLTYRGYCADGLERILVFDYMPNLSLHAHLHGVHAAECLLDWHRRMSIAVGSARAISFLHSGASPQIIHNGIKASNILLDADFQAHVADFGLSTIVLEGGRYDNQAHEAQVGYLAPEYIMSGKLSTSSDVYSFGILLLELASGRRPIEKAGSMKAQTIRSWAVALARDGRFVEIADSKLNDKYLEPEFKRVVQIGLACTQIEPGKRPTMQDVVVMLKGESKEALLKLDNQDIYQPSLSAATSQSTSMRYEISDTVSEGDPLVLKTR